MFNQAMAMFIAVLWAIVGIVMGNEIPFVISTMFVATSLIISEIRNSK